MGNGPGLKQLLGQAFTRGCAIWKRAIPTPGFKFEDLHVQRQML